MCCEGACVEVPGYAERGDMRRFQDRLFKNRGRAPIIQIRHAANTNLPHGPGKVKKNGTLSCARSRTASTECSDSDRNVGCCGRGAPQARSPSSRRCAMRLVTYQSHAGPRIAAVVSQGLVDLNHADPDLPSSMRLLAVVGVRGVAAGQPGDPNCPIAQRPRRLGSCLPSPIRPRSCVSG